MWNLVSSNRIIDRKLKQEAHFKHRKALANVRPSINNRPPDQYSFLYSRPKQHLLKYQRQHDIQKHNTILIDRMLFGSSELRPRKSVLLKESLNSAYRSRVEREIDEGNQKLVRRLQSAKSQYHTSSKDISNYRQYKQNMANSRMDPYYDMPAQNHCFKRPLSAKR